MPAGNIAYEQAGLSANSIIWIFNNLLYFYQAFDSSTPCQTHRQITLASIARGIRNKIIKPSTSQKKKREFITSWKDRTCKLNAQNGKLGSIELINQNQNRNSYAEGKLQLFGFSSLSCALNYWAYGHKLIAEKGFEKYWELGMP